MSQDTFSPEDLANKVLSYLARNGVADLDLLAIHTRVHDTRKLVPAIEYLLGRNLIEPVDMGEEYSQRRGVLYAVYRLRR